MMQRFAQFFAVLIAVTFIGLQSLSVHPPRAEQSLTATPTLTVDAHLISALQTLLDAPDCELPCFMGLNPGITSGDVLKQFVAQFNITDSLPVVTPKLAINYDLNLFFEPGLLSVNFWGRNNQLRRMKVLLIDPEKRLTANNPLNLSVLLQNLGTPSDIYVAIQRNYPGTSTLTLVYSLQHVMVTYLVALPKIESSSSPISICPSPENTIQTQAWLQNSSDSRPIVGYLEPAPDAPDNFGANWTLQRMTGMDIEAFVKLFSDDTEACIVALSASDLYELGL